MMGWINGAIYMMCGCSYWWGVFRPLENLPKSYFFLVGLSGVVFMLIPISMFLGVHELFLFWLCLLAYAWLHARAYGIIAPMISRKFNPDNDGLALGIWTSSSDMGNVLAFFFFTLIIYGLSWSWKFCLLLSGFFALVMATLMLTLDDGTKEDTTAHATCSQYTKEIWLFVKIPDNVLATCVVLFSGASTYGVLLWLPMFLEGAGFEDFEGYISMTYSISTIIGTTILGKLYEITHKSRYHLMINCGTILLSIISFILIKSIPLEPSQKFVVLLLVGVVGFSMGSTFNLSFSH
jgi:sugar phosphate permease